MRLIEKQIWARERVKYWWNKCCDVHGAEQRIRDLCPTVEFSNRMTRTAGLAYSSRRHIKLSNHFLDKESTEDYDQTIGHEVAHVFADRWYGTRCKHGGLWKRCMVNIGLEPKRCHQYESTKPKQKQDRIKVACTGCGKHITLTKNRVSRIRNMTNNYNCAVCKTPLNRIHVIITADLCMKGSK